MLWGLHCAPFVSFGNLHGLFGTPWAASGHTLGHLGLHQDVLGASRDSFGDFASTGDPLRKPMALKYRACAQKQTRWNTHTVYGGDGETVHELQFRPPVPHAPGIRMT